MIQFLFITSLPVLRCGNRTSLASKDRKSLLNGPAPEDLAKLEPVRQQAVEFIEKCIGIKGKMEALASGYSTKEAPPIDPLLFWGIIDELGSYSKYEKESEDIVKKLVTDALLRNQDAIVRHYNSDSDTLKLERQRYIKMMIYNLAFLCGWKCKIYGETLFVASYITRNVGIRARWYSINEPFGYPDWAEEESTMGYKSGFVNVEVHSIYYNESLTGSTKKIGLFFTLIGLLISGKHVIPVEMEFYRKFAVNPYFDLANANAKNGNKVVGLSRVRKMQTFMSDKLFIAALKASVEWVEVDFSYPREDYLEVVEFITAIAPKRVVIALDGQLFARWHNMLKFAKDSEIEELKIDSDDADIREEDLRQLLSYKIRCFVAVVIKHTAMEHFICNNLKEIRALETLVIERHDFSLEVAEAIRTLQIKTLIMCFNPREMYPDASEAKQMPAPLERKLEFLRIVLQSESIEHYIVKVDDFHTVDRDTESLELLIAKIKSLRSGKGGRSNRKESGERKFGIVQSRKSKVINLTF